jgi:hypothetical protein
MLMRRSIKQRDAQRGGAAVEFALILPIFVAIMFGMIDYGWYYYQKFTLCAAIRAGVRYGVTFKDDVANGSSPYAEAKAEAERRCDPAVLPKTAITFSGEVSGTAPIKYLRLRGTYTFTPLVGLVRTPNSSVRYEMTMVLEQPYNTP